MGLLRQFKNKNEKITNNKIAPNEDISRGRSNGKRTGSTKRKTLSGHSKRPISPNVNTFYGHIAGIDHTNLISKGNLHQKMISATNGFDMYNQAENVYANDKPLKSKSTKRPVSKKEARIRYFN